MRRRLPLAVGVLCLLGPAAASAAVHVRAVDAVGYPRLRVSVVTDRPSTKPPTLRENGNPVENASAVNLGSSKSVVLAIDRSQSMTGKPLATALVAAKAFVDAKPGSDQIAVSTFASQALPPTPFSTSTTDSDAALRSIAVDGKPGTKLFDDLMLDVGSLAQQSTPGKVIIVVTDGNETSSSASLGDVVSSARRAHVAVYVIAIESKLFSPAKLRELAGHTGGSYYAAASPGYLAQIYRRIADELSRTWQID